MSIKNVSVVYDRDGWAFHNIAKQILKHSEHFVKITPAWPGPFVEKDLRGSQAVVLLWYGSHNVLDMAPDGCKKIVCVYDESLWTNNLDHRRDLLTAIDKADVVMGSSRTIRSRLATLTAKPILDCADGVDPSLFPVVSPREPGDKIRVGWTGNSDPSAHGDNKGLALIQEAASLLYEEAVFDILDRRGVVEWVPHSKMGQWYRNLDLVLCMSRYEGTPNPILEASCSGIPWVSTDVGIVRDLWDHTDGKGGIIVERRVDALVEAVRQCHQERSILWARGSRGAKAVRDLWTWETRARSFDEAIRVAFDEARQGS